MKKFETPKLEVEIIEVPNVIATSNDGCSENWDLPE